MTTAETTRTAPIILFIDPLLQPAVLNRYHENVLEEISNRREAQPTGQARIAGFDSQLRKPRCILAPGNGFEFSRDSRKKISA
jgi:hypothetical protein